MLDRLSFLKLTTRPLMTDFGEARVDLTGAHLAEIPALRGGLAEKIKLLPLRGRLIDTEGMLAHRLRSLRLRSEAREAERGEEFMILTPHQLTRFGEAVSLMRQTFELRGLAKVPFTGPAGVQKIFEVEQPVADSRQVTARLAVNEGKLEIVFSIYRHVVSLLDYVQIAVPLPGLAVYRHTERPGFYLAADR